MKTIYQFICVFCAACGYLTLTSCSDFFETEPKNIINEDQYIAKEDEMYKGFLGIFTKVQQAGDHSIFLTDTRCNVLEVTDNAPNDLQDIYYYNNTDGNPYADPTCYYAVIIACNDYIHKMSQYHHNTGGMSENGEEHFKELLSLTIRTKVWAYNMLGRIYGQAYWFDDPLTEIHSLSDANIFTRCNMKELADKAIALLEYGIDVDGVHIDSDLRMTWNKWYDPENQSNTNTLKYEYLTPPRIVLEAEFRSWRASYLTEDAAQQDWAWIHENLLKWMYQIHTTEASVSGISGMTIPGFSMSDVSDDAWVAGNSPSYVYQTNIPLQSDPTYSYYTIFCSEEVGNRMQLISGIMYDYTNHQRNRLVQYFCPTFPDANAFYLQPSQYGLSLYGEDDLRSPAQKMVFNTLGGKTALTKYYYSYDTNTRTYHYLNDKELFMIEPTIITFRGHDLHFLLAEAATHLGYFRQANAILNMGLNNEFADKKLPTDEAGWSTYFQSWFGGNGGYGDVGIVGCARGDVHPLPTLAEAQAAGISAEQLKVMYDWAIADEHTKEYVGEGKSLSFLCKVAERTARGGNDAAARDSMARRIAPKYAANGLQSKVANAIQSNGYFIQWDLKDLK